MDKLICDFLGEILKLYQHRLMLYKQTGIDYSDTDMITFNDHLNVLSNDYSIYLTRQLRDSIIQQIGAFYTSTKDL